MNIEDTPLFPLSEKDIAYHNLIYPGKMPSMIHDPTENVRLGLMGFFLITMFCIFGMIACFCIRIYLQWSQIKLEDGQLLADEFVVRFEDVINVGIEDPVPSYSGTPYFTLTEWAVEAISNSLYTRQLTPISTQRSLMFGQSCDSMDELDHPYSLPPPPLYEEIAAELLRS